MPADSSVEASKIPGPSGFIELNGQMLVVDFGKIYQDTTPVGFLHEDGLISSSNALLGNAQAVRPIEDVAGCRFRGIDAAGMELLLPGPLPGPTGKLLYNGVPLNVVHGRIATFDHKLIGEMDDSGNLVMRDYAKKDARRRIDEHSQFATSFKGQKSSGEDWHYNFIRPMHKPDRKYSDNEIIRYFQEFDQLNSAQKKYVMESLKLWACSGLLQIVRKSEGDCALGSVKHGAAGQTGVRTGQVTLDREEFEKEIGLYKRFGSLFTSPTSARSHVEVRLNLVVSHEFGHQLEFVLSKAAQDRIAQIYQKRLAASSALFPPPGDYDGHSELLPMERVEKRVFISGYSRSSEHEYWAEATAAFSVKESRDILKRYDPEIHNFFVELLFHPEQMVRPIFVDLILALQASLRAGGEFSNDLLQA